MFNWLTKGQQPGIFIYRQKFIGEVGDAPEETRQGGESNSSS